MPCYPAWKLVPLVMPLVTPIGKHHHAWAQVSVSNSPAGLLKDHYAQLGLFEPTVSIKALEATSTKPMSESARWHVRNRPRTVVSLGPDYAPYALRRLPHRIESQVIILLKLHVRFKRCDKG
jgi:hypothetical protein